MLGAFNLEQLVVYGRLDKNWDFDMSSVAQGRHDVGCFGVFYVLSCCRIDVTVYADKFIQVRNIRRCLRGRVSCMRLVRNTR